MVEVNEYFDGRVKSFVIDSKDGKKTIGAMSEGQFEINTDSKELMTVLAGSISVYLEDENEWEEFGAGSSFDVPAKSKLKVRVTQDTAYFCEYE